MLTRRPSAKVYTRWMIARDMPDVLAIEEASNPGPWQATEFDGVLRLRDTIGMVAEYDGEVVGFMIYTLNPSYIDLAKLAVYPEFRRAGIGLAMSETIFGKLARGKREAVAAIVRESNLGGQLFLRAAGLRWVETLPGHYADTNEDGYVMRYHLEDKAC